MKSPEKMQRRINNLLKVFCCGSVAADAAKGSSSDQPLVLSASVSGSQDTVFEASSKGNNLSERDKNSAWLSRKNWHEKQRGLRHSAPSISHQDLTKNNEDYVAVDGAAAGQNKRAPSCPESSAGSPPVPDRALKPKINSSTHTPNSPISPPGTNGSNYSSTGNEDKFFPDYPIIAKNPSSVSSSEKPASCAYVAVDEIATRAFELSQKQASGAN